MAKQKKKKPRLFYNVPELYFDIWVEVFGLKRPDGLKKGYDSVGDTILSFTVYLTTKDYIISKISLWRYNIKNGTHLKLRTLMS